MSGGPFSAQIERALLAGFPSAVIVSVSGSDAPNGSITIQGTTSPIKTTSVTFIEPSVGNGPQAPAGKVQIGTPDVTNGGLNGGIGRPPSTVAGIVFIDGGGQQFITAPTQGDVLLGLRPYDNKQGLDIIAENQSGNIYIDARYLAYTNQDYGTKIAFRMNMGGNSQSNNFAASAFTIFVLNAGGSTSGGGMVGIGNGALNPHAGLDVTPQVIVSSGIVAANAYGAWFHQELVAIANNDILTAHRIEPTFTDSGKTGVKHHGLIVVSGQVGVGTQTPGTKLPNGFVNGQFMEIFNAANDAGLGIRSFTADYGLDIWSDETDAVTYFDSRGDAASIGMRFRTRTFGTPLLNLELDGSGNAIFGGFIAGTEQTAPPAGAANSFRIFAVDSGGGKTVLKVQFATGAAQTLATEP